MEIRLHNIQLTTALGYLGSLVQHIKVTGIVGKGLTNGVEVDALVVY